MTKIKKWWIALLLGALLMATLVGVVWARPMRQTTYKLTIPAGHFHPDEDGYDWDNNGYYITVYSGWGWFHAALPIALPGRFTVEKVTLFAYDNNSGSNVAVSLYRMNPWTGNHEQMAWVTTTSQSGAMQVRSTTNIDPDTVYGSHGAYLILEINDSSALNAYAVQIEYH